MERGIAIAWINYRHFYCFFSNDRELILVMCRKNVLINAFVLDKVIRVMVEVAISA
jgi:hypothetical protein